ncbi:protein kinase subdomain-containing protein PKL CAK Fmp29 [Suillus lakei]|nr:protein kinase subdomain-containing protein PKL CAK Fmp29 [Suillus lakei]
MPCLGSARFSGCLCACPRSSPRSFRVLYSSSIATPTRWPPRREFSIMAHLRSDFFEYTSGRWIFNDDLRHAERRRVFKVDELSRLAAETVNRSPDDIVCLEKLAEGGFNRTFLITMRCGFRMVARIPYPATIPKYFAVASEVATMALLRSSGLPIPEVYGYSPTPNNAAGTEYIFMEFVQGTNLSDIWFDLGEREIISISRQLAELESKMMSIAFPAGGSLYYTEDLENAAGSASRPTRPGITLEDKHFYVGPDTSLRLWHGRRSQLDLNRGPYESAKAALVRGAEKELAYLWRFGRPLLPFQRIRREAYKYQEQPPSDHIENLDRYLLIASSLIPRNSALGHFCMRHPDLQPSNIIVSRSPDSNLHVVGLIDWQHLDPTPQRDGTLPSPPCPLPLLSKTRRSTTSFITRQLTDPMGVLRRRLFCHASDPWEGETLALKVALIQATKNWKMLTGEGPATMKLDAEQKEADESLEACRDRAGCPAEHYEEAMVLSKKLKEDGLAAAESEEERAQIAAHWPLDDMDEEEYDSPQDEAICYLKAAGDLEHLVSLPKRATKILFLDND